MKNFFTSMLGTLAALCIFSVGLGVFVIGFFAVMAASASQRPAPSVEKGSYLVFDLSMNISDAPPPFDTGILAEAFGGSSGPKTLQLRQVTQALAEAKNDGRVAGILITGQLEPDGYGSGFAALKEVRAAINDFKSAGKPVLAYIDYATTRDLYVAASANELYLDPYGAVLLPGLASRSLFLTGAFEKYGVGVQVTRVGKYKSAVEPFTRKDYSPENRDQLQKLLDDMWGDLVADIAADRGIEVKDLQRLVDNEGMIRPETAVEAKLVTKAWYKDQVIEKLKADTGRKGAKRSFKQVSMFDYVKTLPSPGHTPKKETDSAAKNTIAVVYAEGAIVDGKGEPDEVGGDKFAREIRRLRQDDNVKAIVLRVNSPGGSATASEHIQRELRLAKESKPVIVSMGTYAASGGYWISAFSNRIFAEPTTVTGSIGVFGILFDIQKMTQGFGLSYDSVKTGKFADSMTITRPKTPEELAVVQRMVDWIYEEFITKVATARNLDRAKVHEIAQGRVWSGAEAVKLGLVDELGGLEDALRHAAKETGLGGGYNLLEFPRRKEFAELLAEALEGIRPDNTRDAGVVSQFVKEVKSQGRLLEQFNDPRGIYLRMPFEIGVK